MIGKKCATVQSSGAQPVFCSLYILFGDVLVGVAVVVC